MDDVSEDCVLGSLWLQKVSPYSVDHDKMTFTCKLNGQFITLPMSFQPIRKCKTIEPPVIIQPPLAQLMKMERCKYICQGRKPTMDFVAVDRLLNKQY